MATITTTVTIPTTSGTPEPKTVFVEIPKALEAACVERCMANKSLAPKDAILGWVQDRYGSWIKKYCSANYTITMIDDRSFNVVFTNPIEALLFITKVGGR